MLKMAAIDSCRREAVRVQDLASFKMWTRDFVRPIIAHGALACVHGRLYGVGVSLDYVVTIDYPIEHLASIRNASGHMDTPLARRWYEQQKPVFFDASSPEPDIPDTWLTHFRRHALINTAADGVLDTMACVATYFSFHRLPNMNDVMLRETFHSLTLLLHETFTRVIRHYRERTSSLIDYFSFLTNREQEIARWISQGKSNSDIGHLVGVSENTVKNHVSRILDKTGTGNRAGLAAAITVQEQNRFGMGTKVL
jgi:DNA-binding CsgD family transcriptional regulator